MKPLWKIRSGEFAGWLNDDILYDANGKNVGWATENNEFYSLNGEYIGELFDNDWVGKQLSVAHPRYGGRVGFVGIALARYANRAGLSIAGWEDPAF